MGSGTSTVGPFQPSPDETSSSSAHLPPSVPSQPSPLEVKDEPLPDLPLPEEEPPDLPDFPELELLDHDELDHPSLAHAGTQTCWS